MKPLLIFDYDGTIHDTIRIYEPAFREVYKEITDKGYCVFEDIPIQRIKGWLGMNSKEMWNDFMPQLSEKIKEESGTKIGKLMVRQIEEHKAHWYEGAKEVLTQLKKEGYPMVILSNCKIAYKNANWEEFSMDQWFLEFYDCETYEFAPKTKIIQHIKEKYQMESVVIGDRDSDLACARSSNSLFIGCEYGFGKENELDKADLLARNIKKIPDLVKKLPSTGSVKRQKI